MAKKKIKADSNYKQKQLQGARYFYKKYSRTTGKFTGDSAWMTTHEAKSLGNPTYYWVREDPRDSFKGL